MEAAAELSSGVRGGKGRLLLVYAQRAHAASLVGLLSDDHREVISCPTTAPVRDLIDELEPALILLVPPADRDGILETCAWLRRETARPIAVLSEEGNDVVVARAFSAGVDEYLMLPIADRELTARVDAMLRRWSTTQAQNASLGDLTISPGDLSVEYGGQKIFLSPIEFRLLSCFAMAPNKILTHEALMSRVWGPEYADSRHYLHLYIRYLREKLEDDPKEPKMILNVWGVGYRFVPPRH